MSLSADLREFIALLNSRGVEYVIVGGHSLAFHGRPRYTGDLDILIRPSPENATRLSTVMTEFGFAETGFKESDFLEPDQMIQLGRIPNRIDLLDGNYGSRDRRSVSKQSAYGTRRASRIILSEATPIQNKRAVGRPQDLADLDTLT
jgi:hypothetical protein